MIDLTLSKGFKKRLYDFFIIAIAFGIAYYVLTCLYDLFKSKIVEGNTNPDYTVVLNEEWDTHLHGKTFTHGEAIGNWVLDCSGDFYDYGENNNVHIVEYNGTNKGLAMDTYMDASGGEEIVVQTSVTVDKDKNYELDARIFIETDHDTTSTNISKYYIRLFDENSVNSATSYVRTTDSGVEKKAETVTLSYSSDNILVDDTIPSDAFYNINGTYYTNSTKLYIELVCKTTSIATEKNRVVWGPIVLRTKKCPSSKCKFDPCKGPQVPGGVNSSTGKSWTGNNYGGSLDLPTIGVDGISYFYKTIPQSCDPDVENCFDTDCNSCESGKLYMDQTSLNNVGYSAPDDSTGTIIKKDTCSGIPYEKLDQSSFEEKKDNTDSGSGYDYASKVISGLFTGIFTSAKGLLYITGGSIQALGGGFYSIYDNESGEAVVVDGLGNAVEGGDKIVKGLIEAGKLPVDAIFNVNLKKIGDKSLKELIEESGDNEEGEGEGGGESNSGSNAGYVPYEATISF